MLDSVKFQHKIQERTEIRKIDTTETVSTQRRANAPTVHWANRTVHWANWIVHWANRTVHWSDRSNSEPGSEFWVGFKIFLGNYEREDRPRREFNDDKQQIFVGGLPSTMSEQDIRDVFR